MKIFKTKLFLLTYLSVLLVGAAWWYINQSLYGTRAATVPVNITFTPKTGSVSTVDVIMQSSDTTKKISAFDLTFKTTGQISVTGFAQPQDLATGDTFGQKIIDTRGETTSRVVYTDSRSDTDLPGAVKLTVQLGGTGEGTLTIDKAASQIAGNVTDHIYSFGNVDEGNYTVSGGGGGEGNIKLNLGVRFQGIVTKPTHGDKMMVRAKLVSVSKATITDYQAAEFTADAGGVFRGSISFNAPESADYYVLVKGQQHMAKKICVAAPSETATGTYRCAVGAINLATGDNNLDFSGVRMLVGDLPTQGDASGSQDGVVDSFDVSFIRQNLGNSDEDALAVGDLNHDGVIDSQDFSLVIASLTVKYDEE